MRSLAAAPASASTCAMPGASISPWRIASSDGERRDHRLAVVQGDGDVRGGGVEGEQHGPSLGRGAAEMPGPSRAARCGPSSNRQRGPTGVSVSGRGRRRRRRVRPSSRRSYGQRLGQALAPLHDGDRLLDVGVEVEVVELGGAAEPVGVDVDQRRARRSSEGCTRAITKVGEVTSPRTPSPSPMPWVSVVLPAPRSPVRITRSPGASRVASQPPKVAGVLGGGQDAA